MTTPCTNTQIAAIAKGLTKAQREACLAGKNWYPRCRDCADEDGTCPGWHSWPCDRTERAPYEVAVRAILETNNDR